MRYKSHLALFICLLTLSCDDAIDPDTSGKFIKFYGGAHDETAYDVEEIPGEGFVIVGSTDILGDGNKDVLVIRTDLNGDRLAQEPITYNGGAGLNDEGRSVAIDLNGDILVLGYTTKSAADRDFLLLSVSPSGSVKDSIYGEPDVMEEGFFLSPSGDGGHLLIGNQEDGNDTQQGSVYLVKVDPGLQKQFERGYGLFNEPDSTGNMVEAGNGNLVWCGTVARGEHTVARVVMSDAFGNLIADTQYRKDGASVSGKNMQPVSGGYVVVGSSVLATNIKEASIFIINTDGLRGDTWEVGKINPGENQYGNAIYPTTDGNYIITGKTVSGSNSDVLLLKCTRQGEVLWKKQFGGAGADEGTVVKQTSDGGYIILATVEAANNTVIALIKTDAEGNSIGSLAKQ